MYDDGLYRVHSKFGPKSATWIIKIEDGKVEVVHAMKDRQANSFGQREFFAVNVMVGPVDHKVAYATP